MTHIAILKKSWGFLPKILSGIKTVESRWYKNKAAPWDKIRAGDTLYFKDSGGPVVIKATVLNVIQYEVGDSREALEIMQKWVMPDTGSEEISDSLKAYITNKKYAVFVFFGNVESVKPFKINKRGFGMQSAWICTSSIENLKIQPS